jgi:fused signal recognition particle receptor
MLQETMEVQELSLEKVIETRLVQNNVTDQVLAALREKYGNMKLKALDDKESYLELKVAAKDCAKVRNLVVKVCKEGREDAVKQQKLWIAKEKEVISKVTEIEGPLDAEVAKFDAEVQRKATEEKERQEAAYINRQATLTKMGAVYENGNFVLGNASFEALLVKECSQDVWEEAVVPKYRAEYEIIESEKAEKERAIAAEKAEMLRQQEAFRIEQENFKKEQAELKRQQEEAQRIINEQQAAERREQEKVALEAEYERRKVEAERLAEEKRVADIEAAIKKEQERHAEELRLAEIRRQQDEARRVEELAQASDMEKYKDLVAKIKAISLPEMRSGQYRKKVQVIREKIGEIMAL